MKHHSQTRGGKKPPFPRGGFQRRVCQKGKSRSNDIALSPCWLSAAQALGGCCTAVRQCKHRIAAPHTSIRADRKLPWTLFGWFIIPTFPKPSTSCFSSSPTRVATYLCFTSPSWPPPHSCWCSRNLVYTRGMLQPTPAGSFPGLSLSVPVNAGLNVFFQLSVLLS